MDRIHDRANKFIKDVRKKVGINVHKDNKDQQIIQDSLQASDLSNVCLYCQKVFFNSRFLVRHVLRRHSDDLIVLHNKCSKFEFNNNSNDLKYLLSFLQEEFLMLRNELTVVKQAVANKCTENGNVGATIKDKDIDFQENDDVMNENIAQSNKNISKINSGEFEVIEKKIHDVKDDIKCLYNKVEELNKVLKNEVVMKQDINEAMTFNNEQVLRVQESKFGELRQVLLNDLQGIFSEQLLENDNQWRSQISRLSQEVEQLHCIVDDVKSQVNSPNYLESLKEKLEHDISLFLGSTKQKSRKAKTLKSKSITSKSKLYCSSEENGFNPKLSCEGSFDSKAGKSVKHKQVHSTSYASSEELSLMVSERLSHFNISSNVSKMSSVEFNEKFKLVNSEKEYLIKRYPNFLEVYDRINMQADDKVCRNLENKKSRKIRFRDPLVSNNNMLHDSVSSKENLQNKPYQFVQSKSQHTSAVKNRKLSVKKCNKFIPISNGKSIPVSEEFTFVDIEGSGDYSPNFPDNPNHFIKETLESTSGISVHGFKTSSPVTQAQTFEKTDSINFVPSDLYKTSGIAISNIHEKTDSSLKYHADKIKESSFRDNIKKFDKTQDCNFVVDDFDNNSLQSLSSWEGESEEILSGDRKLN